MVVTLVVVSKDVGASNLRVMKGAARSWSVRCAGIVRRAYGL